MAGDRAGSSGSVGPIFAAGGYQQRRAMEEHFGLSPHEPFVQEFSQVISYIRNNKL
jgi:hypothetical protein